MDAYEKLVRDIAKLEKWQPGDERVPSDGTQDSHDTLMRMIDEARAVSADTRCCDGKSQAQEDCCGFPLVRCSACVGGWFADRQPCGVCVGSGFVLRKPS